MTNVPRLRPPGGQETVLLVEDEESVRELVRDFVSRLGYTVLEAHDPVEASSFCETHPGAIHLLLTDVMMPEISGRVLADRLRLLRPAMRVLFVSGYADDSVLEGTELAGSAFLQKPFSLDVLARTVRELLDRP